MSSKLGMHALLNHEQGHETLIRMGADIDKKWLPFIQNHVQATQEEAKKQSEILKAIQVDAARAKAASIMELIRLTTATITKDQKQYQALIKRCIEISLEGMTCMLKSSTDILEKVVARIIHQATVNGHRMYQVMTHLKPGRITSHPDMSHTTITNANATLHDMTAKNQEYIEYDKVFLENTATYLLQNAVPEYDDVARQYTQTHEELERLRNTNSVYEKKLEQIKEQQKGYSIGIHHSEQDQEREESKHKEACLNLQAETDSLIQAAFNAQSDSRSLEKTSDEILQTISWERYAGKEYNSLPYMT